jgi:beta-lactamase superfamily II metal-dependent hydrolase
MLLAEENGKTVLLTGDGHSDHIVAGLEQSGHLNTGKLHVNLLKVQHHGSEHNIDEEFCKKITADRYLFCGNGQHENPDLAVIKLIVASRMRAGDSGRFKLLFNSRDTVSTNDRGKAHMTEVEALVNSLAAKSNGRMSASFLEKSSFKLKL